MQTENKIDLNPQLILEEYEKYDVGETPYTTKRKKDGEIELVPHQVLDTIKLGRQKTTENPVRQAVLDLVSEWKVTELNQLIDDMVSYLLVEYDDSNNKHHLTKKGMLEVGKLRFLRFLVDLPHDVGNSMMKKLIKDDQTGDRLRDFVEMVEPNAPMNPLVDVILEYYGEPDSK